MIIANWSAPGHIQAVTTTRCGGNSLVPYAGNNLALHVGDSQQQVLANRQMIRAKLPAEPVWLEQTHSTIICNIDDTQDEVPFADGSITTQVNKICSVMTADCLPILVCDSRGKQVAAIHAGWRGLANGIIESCINQFKDPAHLLHVWLGPAISPEHFEVGEEVFNTFVEQNPEDIVCFKSLSYKFQADKYLANLYQLATARLNRLGIIKVSGGDYCTFKQADQFFSYRRDGQTGRMASMIWIT